MQAQVDPIAESLDLLCRLRTLPIYKFETNAPAARLMAANVRQALLAMGRDHDFCKAPAACPHVERVILTADPEIHDLFLTDSDGFRIILDPDSDSGRRLFACASPEILDSARRKGLCAGNGILALFNRIARQDTPASETLASERTPCSSTALSDALVRLAHASPWVQFHTPSSLHWCTTFLETCGHAPETMLACLRAQISSFPDIMADLLRRNIHRGNVAMTALLLSQGVRCDNPDNAGNTADPADPMRRLVRATQSGHGRLALGRIDARALIVKIATRRGNADMLVKRDPNFPN